MSYYERHIFFCCNQREPGAKQCCNNHGAQRAARLRQEPRERAQALGRRARCASTWRAASTAATKARVVVVYPEAVWYTYVDREDIDEIVDEHLQNGRIVERLRI